MSQKELATTMVENHSKNLQTLTQRKTQLVDQKRQIDEALVTLDTQIAMITGAVRALNELLEESRKSEASDVEPAKV